MPEVVYLHVGLPKTGTTYLQHVLWANKRELGRRGLLLPGPGHRRHLLASLDLREDPGLAHRAGGNAHPWTRLVAEARRWSRDVLITHEFFGAASVPQIRRAVEAFPGASVEVIVTARPMVDLGISRWQEWIRNGAKGQIDSYPRRSDYDPADEWGWGSFDLDDILARWGEVIAHERIHVIPLAPRGAPPTDLLERFLGVLGLTADGLRVPERPANESLGIVEAELLRRVNAELRGFSSAFDRGQWIRGHLAKAIPPGREPMRPGHALVAELTTRGERAMARLADGYDVRGDVAWLQPSDVSARRHPDEVTDGELLVAATRTIAELMSQVRELSTATDDQPPTSSVAGTGRPRRVTVARILSRAGLRGRS